MKDMKRDFLVEWIEWGTRHYRFYYRENDAKNFAFSLIHKEMIPEHLVAVIDCRK